MNFLSTGKHALSTAYTEQVVKTLRSCCVAFYQLEKLQNTVLSLFCLVGAHGFMIYDETIRFEERLLTLSAPCKFHLYLFNASAITGYTKLGITVSLLDTQTIYTVYINPIRYFRINSLHINQRCVQFSNIKDTFAQNSLVV